jgi:hypothetical protein
MTKTAARNSQSSKKSFEHKDGHGSLFYDAPGVPTLSGSFRVGKSYEVTGEPAVDKNQNDYTRISGNGVSGGLFNNDRKESPNHPDYTGPIDVDGKKYRMAAWKKETKSGEHAGQEYLSLAISEIKPRN